MINKYFYIIFSFIIGFAYSSVTESNTGWSYLSSDQQTFYIFVSSIDITDQSGNIIEGHGDGSGSSSSSGTEDCMLDPTLCDVVGAFTSHQISESECVNIANGTFNQDLNICEVCVGWIYYNSYSGNSMGIVSTTLPLMGQTSSQDPIYDYYLANNNIPYLKFYDSSEDITYLLESDSQLGEFFNNNIFVYYPDCEGVGDGCIEINFSASVEESGDLSNMENSIIPETFSIINAYPNPFNPSTKITYNLSSVEFINIKVIDSLGSEIETLFSDYGGIGTHELLWVPSSSISSGQYFIQISTPENSAILKVTYIK